MAKDTISAKQVVPWLLTAVAGYAVVQVLDKFFGKSSSDKSLEETSKTVKQEIKKQEEAGVYPSYTDAQYKTLADSLLDAMKGPGTDETKVYQAINMMKNSVDVLKLIDAFGIRDSAGFPFSNMMNLGQWFRNELSADELFIVNKRLATNGIKWQF